MSRAWTLVAIVALAAVVATTLARGGPTDEDATPVTIGQPLAEGELPSVGRAPLAPRPALSLEERKEAYELGDFDLLWPDTGE